MNTSAKPHIEKIAGEWFCSSFFYGTVGHRLRAFGYGDTPAIAYANWKAHWGNRK